MLLALKPLSEFDTLIPKAVEFARQQNLLIDGVSIIDEARLAPPQSVPPGAGSFKLESDRHAIAMGRESATALMTQLSDTARSQGVECESHVEDGNVSLVLSTVVQRCDLMVCGAKQNANASERSLLFSILKHSARPVLVMPPEPTEQRDILVAYDGSLQSTKTLASLVSSGFWKDRTVHLVTIESGNTKHAGCEKSAATFLDRHGIHHQLHVCESSGNVGRDIVSEVDRLAVGLVVIGAFGKSTVMDFFLGSVTRKMLDALPVPLLLEH